MKGQSLVGLCKYICLAIDLDSVETRFSLKIRTGGLSLNWRKFLFESYDT